MKNLILLFCLLLSYATRRQSSDFSVFKFLNLGVAYQHSVYVFNNMDHEDSRLHKAGFNFFTSLRL